MIFCSLVLLLFQGGCGGGPQKPEGMPPLYPCSITIIQDETPLAGAVVSLISPDGDGKWSSSAQTDEKGVAKLITYGQFQGSPAGTYHVTVSKRVSDGEPPKPNVDENGRVLGPPTLVVPSYIELVAMEYTSSKTTPLTIEVKPAKKGNDQTFDVGKAVQMKSNRP
ncbi:MAG: carboxypeptidase-like regulatory domain-containing protein [Planctomycetaceae bacterium]|nr:carboxypeptidase-like regulatory domain-containing protein [Planctomycetaceae bacterium]